MLSPEQLDVYIKKYVNEYQKESKTSSSKKDTKGVAKNNKKYVIDDEDDDDEETDEDDDEETDEDDDEETDDDTDEDDDEETEDSSYYPADTEEEWEDDVDEEEGEEEILPKISHAYVQDVISKIFPSKYMTKKMKQTEEEKEVKKSKETGKKSKEKSKEDVKKSKEDVKKSKESKEKRRTDTISKRGERKQQKGEDSEEEENNKYNIMVLGIEDEYIDEEDEYNEEDDNVECNSDDEQQFMKEKYEKIDIGIKKERKEKKREKKEKKTEEMEPLQENTEVEYLQMVDTKKHLIEQMKKQPKSKFLKKSIKNCDIEIKKWIKETRTKNTKNYHKLIHSGEDHQTNEIDYFRKKLSNAEQIRVMNDLKEINDYVIVKKP
jgi:hypothetical protein